MVHGHNRVEAVLGDSSTAGVEKATTVVGDQEIKRLKFQAFPFPPGIKHRLCVPLVPGITD